ncbi:hypothetical protein [Luminiphilus syltensis]|uniref:hypothetical protein n=1 Tax=Luminiphilus syltensis TaxID=1341119 RepID=UPI0012B5C3DE|nr:hypothetical protein [Luminiphilus syltensis]
MTHYDQQIRHVASGELAFSAVPHAEIIDLPGLTDASTGVNNANEHTFLIHTPEMSSQAPIELRGAVEDILTENATIGRVKRRDLRLESSRKALLVGAT